MITPKFSCSQTADAVIIRMYCPSVRAADVEIHVEDTLFSVHINPYFLRLNFSHPVVEDDDQANATYDAGEGWLTVTLVKQEKGQEFADLDLLGKLLAPKPSAPRQPEIEVIGSEEDELVAQTEGLSLSSEQQEILLAEENDWQIPQTIPDESSSISLSLTQSYGFLNRYTGYFTHVAHTENEVNELGAEAERLTPGERRQKRFDREDDKFDDEYYMADYAADEHVQELLLWKNPHIESTTESFEFTEEEKLALLTLPRREYLASPQESSALYLTLATILFAYSYDARTTEGEPTPESAWTICSLTPAFAALDPAPYSIEPTSEITPMDLLATFVQSYRRTLAFPLHRSFILAEACRNDTARLLVTGKRAILRVLLRMKDILAHHEVYYVYNKIWVEDFCVWVQSTASDDVLRSLGTVLLSPGFRIPRGAIGWDLEDLEEFTREKEGGDR
ncbi:CS domain-containing protein [Mycena indigotica]|uniref:CS domain-containing protein n=1 Tax=Mycena indigotica TaxID=2126181 RepID=A0A8H6SSK3_9AGAR|nr:CS domain-containing protein [Mycena indigotica]KAF7303612.1 CS domain-containing protein [Mycena indigotica]